jgi:hypothetical protein
MRNVLLLFALMLAVSLPSLQAGDSKPPPDYELKAKIRKKAPFWIEDSRTGAAYRINKDGSLTSDASSGSQSAGSWKVQKGQLKVSLSLSGDELSYSLDLKKDGTPLIDGSSPKKGRYSIHH